MMIIIHILQLKKLREKKKPNSSKTTQYIIGYRTKMYLLFDTTTLTYFSDAAPDSDRLGITWTSCRIKLALLLSSSPSALSSFILSHVHSWHLVPCDLSTVCSTPPFVWMWFQRHRLKVEKITLSTALTTGLIWGWVCNLSQSNHSDFREFPGDSWTVTPMLGAMQGVVVVPR